MEIFAPYGHALVSIALFAVIGLILGPVGAAISTGRGYDPGAIPKPDYGDISYRLTRAYQNAMETMGFFAGVTLAAILAGADPWWTNTFASVFLVSRILLVVVHLAGMGPKNFGPRTIVYVIGWVCLLALAYMATAAVFA